METETLKVNDPNLDDDMYDLCDLMAQLSLEDLDGPIEGCVCCGGEVPDWDYTCAACFDDINRPD
jgi:hypothetical protein